MNIFPMTQAAEQLNTALQMTINPTERAEIGNIRDRLLGQLRKRGVFIGTEPEAKAASEADGVPWCEPCQSWHDKPKNKEHHAALKCFAPWIEPAPKAASRETSAPNSLTPDPACPHCEGTGVGVGGVFTNCICTYGKPAPPIMDDLRRDLNRLCQEQQEKIATLTYENNSWHADSKALERLHNLLCESMPGFKGCPSPPDWCFAALVELLEQRMLLNGNLEDMTKRYEHLERLYFQMTGKNDSPASNGTIKTAKQIMARVDATSPTLREA